MPRYPNADSQRVNRNKPAFDWVALPAAGRPGPPPELPPLRSWSDQTLAWWAALWATPQATQWDHSGETAWPMAVLYQAVQDVEPERTAGVLAELRQHQDRHGLNPKALLQLRWRVVDEDGAEIDDTFAAIVGGLPDLKVVL